MQSLAPISNPAEKGSNIKELVEKLNAHKTTANYFITPMATARQQAKGH